MVAEDNLRGQWIYQEFEYVINITPILHNFNIINILFKNNSLSFVFDFCNQQSFKINLHAISAYRMLVISGIARFRHDEIVLVLKYLMKFANKSYNCHRFKYLIDLYFLKRSYTVCSSCPHTLNFHDRGVLFQKYLNFSDRTRRDKHA